LFTKNSSWQAKQLIPHTLVTLYGDVKTYEDFTPNFGSKRTGYCIMTTYHLTFPSFTREFLNQDNMTVIPHPPYSPDLAPCRFSVSPIDDKIERPPF
jgi:hypothetical protein